MSEMFWPGDPGAPYSEPLQIVEFQRGVCWWRAETNWPPDFHNELYGSLNDLRQGWPDFTKWWVFVPRELERWGAWVEYPGSIPVAEIDRRIKRQEPNLSQSILDLKETIKSKKLAFPNIDWLQVRELAVLLHKVKDVSSPVATSKLGHFLFPEVYPVTDNRALGMPGANRYDRYYNYFRHCWKRTDEPVQRTLSQALIELIETHGEPVTEGYPVEVKVTELCLIGRKQKAQRVPTEWVV